MKAAIFVFTCLVLSLVVIWSQWPDRYVHLVVCDVGQGDAILLTQGFTQVLIDGGKDEKVLTCLRNHLPWWDHQLELMVGTHADADHIGGLPAVLSAYSVRKLLFSGAKNTADFEAFKDSYSREGLRGMEHLKPHLGRWWGVGEKAFMTVLSETQLSAAGAKKNLIEEGSNDGSIVIKVTVGEVEILLTGDIEEAGEAALVRNGLISDIDILKVAHHGSKTSSHEWFLAKARPEIAIISAGKNNPYGHPHSQVLDRLRESGVQVLRTDQLGEVEVVIDGLKYWVL